MHRSIRRPCAEPALPVRRPEGRRAAVHPQRCPGNLLLGKPAARAQASAQMEAQVATYRCDPG